MTKNPGAFSSSFRSLLLKVFVLAVFAAAMAAASKAQDKVELFGAYSYFRASIEVGQTGPLGPGTPCPPNCGTPPHVTQNANLNGWEFSAQYKFLPFLGGVVDFNGTYGTLDGAGTREHTYLLGPQVSLPIKFSPFAHALIGFARESQDPFLSGGFNDLGSSTSWASAVGGGLDWHVAPFVAIRIFQLDYVHTHLHSASQNQPRVSAGVVFHF
jgi:hypothetical protein